MRLLHEWISPRIVPPLSPIEPYQSFGSVGQYIFRQALNCLIVRNDLPANGCVIRFAHSVQLLHGLAAARHHHDVMVSAQGSESAEQPYAIVNGFEDNAERPKSFFRNKGKRYFGSRVGNSRTSLAR